MHPNGDSFHSSWPLSDPHSGPIPDFQTVSEGKFSEVRQFGKLGAPRLPLARKSGVDHMIYIVIVEQLSLALNALSPETQPLGYGAAPLILGRTRDANSVQFQLHKGVIDQCPA